MSRKINAAIIGTGIGLKHLESIEGYRNSLVKIINFIESEWSRPAIVCFTIFLMFFFTFFLSLAEKREAHRIETQTQSWKDQGYPIGQ